MIKLLRAGADADASYSSAYQLSALQLVLESGWYEGALALLTAGANPNRAAPGGGGDTPLHTLSASNTLADQNKQNLIILLLKFGANPKIKDSKGRLPAEVRTYEEATTPKTPVQPPTSSGSSSNSAAEESKREL